MTDFPFKIITTSYDPAQAELHLQYTGMDSFDATTWKASVIGPYCHGRQTIAIAHALEASSSDAFTVRIPEPCYWSPEVPFLYELVLEDTGSQLKYRHRWGLQSLVIKRNQFLLNQEKLALRGVRLTQLFTTELPSRLKQDHVNLLVVPLSHEAAAAAQMGSELGLYVIYKVNPDEDELLWHAESVLFQHISTLGFVLPQ